MNALKNDSTDPSTDESPLTNYRSSKSTDAIVTNESNEKTFDVIDVLIAGAGISGLVTALCLHRAGFSVQLCERAHILEPIGFGLNLQPYCVKLLHELGLESEMDAIGVRTRTAAYYSRHGQPIYQDPRGIDAGYNWPMYSMHRGHFQQLLLRHVCDEIGETSVRLGQKLVAFRSQSNHVEVDFVNPITGQLTTEVAKVLVGADGIHSSVRKILYPDEGPLLWNGVKTWRGVTQMNKIYLDGRTMIYMGNPNERFLLIFPVSDHLVNWALFARVEEPGIRAAPLAFDWKTPGRIEDILPLLSDFKLEFLDIHDLVNSSIIINEFPVTDHDPLPRWSHDRITLIGDAAHPMYPNGGNGASQAILDARGLVLSFREHDVTPEGLKAYDDLRLPVSSGFVLSAREYGPHKILQVVEERSLGDFKNLSSIIASSELEAMLSNYKQLTGWNAQGLNKEPPLF